MKRLHLPSSAITAQRSRGFTLVEVLVALAIVAIALAAGHKASSTLISNTERQDDMLLAKLCANNALTGLRLARTLPGTGESHSACEQAGRLYDVSVNVRGTANPTFRRIDAKVSRDGASVLTISTIMGQY